MKKCNFNIKDCIAKIKAKPSKFIYTALMVLFAAVFLGSATFLIIYYVNSNKQTQQNNELAGIVEQVQQEINNGGSSNIVNPDGSLKVDPDNPLLNDNNILVEVTDPETGEVRDVLREYSTVYLMNPDMVGWVKIPGTKVNYPVMQTPDDPHYSLKKDFYKQYARHGSIYAHEFADVSMPSDNITLYGHNMADGSMFAGLRKYEDPQFYNDHPYIFFDTLTSHQIYKIIAVFYTTDLPEGFPYHDFVDGDEESFMRYVERCKDLSLYEIDDMAYYGNKLLTLSTCDDDVTDSHGRFVVVAMKVSL